MVTSLETLKFAEKQLQSVERSIVSAKKRHCDCVEYENLLKKLSYWKQIVYALRKVIK